MKKLFLFLLLAAVVLAVVFLGILPRLHDSAALAAEVRADSHPPVNIAIARHSRMVNELVLPAALQPYQDAPIYARTSGYIARWLVDIGARVKGGQTLAVIESPEVDQQLNQALANLEQARANLELSRITATRWQDLGKHNAVAQQDVDEKLGSLAAQQAALNAAAAAVRRLENLQSFKNIIAPFDGIVTNRNTDVGDLINSGGASGGQELFRVAQIGTLRVYVNVPEVDSSLIAIGDTATIALASAPGRPAVGKVTSTAKAIDPSSRTLLTEIQIANPGGRFLPGSYAQVIFHLVGGRPPLVIPINTILFRPIGPEVGLVDPHGVVTLRAIEIGRNLGTTVEVVSGLKAEDTVILNPSDSLATGARVRIAPKGNF